MRSLAVIGVTFPAALFLASCSTASVASPSSPTSSPSCASETQAWLKGHGGAAFHAALDATSAMRSAIATGDAAKLEAEAGSMNAATQGAYGSLPPNCDGIGSKYRLGILDWLDGAVDATRGNSKGAASQIVKGAREIAHIAILKHSVQKATVPVLVKIQHVAAPTPAAPATPAQSSAPPAPAESPAPTTPAAPAAPAASPSPATPAGCYPLSDEGTCYEPGEYCRDDDHGTSGMAGDGEAITCEDNDGWRWEPS